MLNRVFFFLRKKRYGEDRKLAVGGASALEDALGGDTDSTWKKNKHLRVGGARSALTNRVRIPANDNAARAAA